MPLAHWSARFVAPTPVRPVCESASVLRLPSRSKMTRVHQLRIKIGLKSLSSTHEARRNTPRGAEVMPGSAGKSPLPGMENEWRASNTLLEARRSAPST